MLRFVMSVCMVATALVSQPVRVDASGRPTLRCHDAYLYYDARMGRSVTSNRSGLCFFRVAMPWQESSTDSLSKASGLIQRAVATGEITGAGSEIVELITDVVNEQSRHEGFSGDGGEIFAARFSEASEMLSECIDTTLAKDDYEKVDSNGLSVTCELDREEGQFYLLAEFGGVSFAFASSVA